MAFGMTQIRMLLLTITITVMMVHSAPVRGPAPLPAPPSNSSQSHPLPVPPSNSSQPLPKAPQAKCFGNPQDFLGNSSLRNSSLGRNSTKPIPIPNGACGYAESENNINNGDVTAVDNNLYRSGAGCGACYQVRCTKRGLCNEGAVKVVVTNTGGGADFIMSAHAFVGMAIKGREKLLAAMGVVDVEYQRVACQYPGNMMIKIMNASTPYYLSLIFLNQGGSRDIAAVELCDSANTTLSSLMQFQRVEKNESQNEECKAMRRSFGAVWEMKDPPFSDIVVRLQLASSNHTQLTLTSQPQALQSPNNTRNAKGKPTPTPNPSRWTLIPNQIPASWKPGASYDSGIQLD